MGTPRASLGQAAADQSCPAACRHEGLCPHGSTQPLVARRQSRHRRSDRWRLQRWRERDRVARWRSEPGRACGDPGDGNGDAGNRRGDSGGLRCHIRHGITQRPHRIRHPWCRWEPHLLDASRRDRHATADNGEREPPVRRIRSRWKSDRLLRRHQRGLRDLDDEAGRHPADATHAPGRQGALSGLLARRQEGRVRRGPGRRSQHARSTRSTQRPARALWP